MSWKANHETYATQYKFPGLREFYEENRHVLDAPVEAAPVVAPRNRKRTPPWWFPTEWKRHLVAFSKRAVEIQWINSMEASLIFGFVIFANAMYIGYEVDNRPKDSGDFWFMMDSLFTGIFVLELALRVRAEGWKTFTHR